MFSSGFLSATLLPGSSEALLASLLTLGKGTPLALTLVATVGNVLGSILNFILGAWLIRFQDRKWFPASPRHLEKAGQWYRRFGVWSLLFSWLPVIGDPLTVFAGLTRVHFGLFCLLVGIGKLVRYSVITGVTLSIL
nr:YqaA family protein [Sneathiella chinensis]